MARYVVKENLPAANYDTAAIEEMKKKDSTAACHLRREQGQDDARRM